MIQKPIQDMKIATLDAAFRRFIRKIMKEGFKVRDVMPINNHRYWIIKGYDKNIMFSYKHEVFYNFGMMFKLQGQFGVGDTLNCEDLRTALRYNVKDIYVVFPNGIAYTIKLKDFLEKSFRWTNKEGKEVRSISIHEYKRYDSI